jgi:hypothetical protein
MGHALLESGLGEGAYASVRFYRSDGSLYDEVEGPGVTLVTDDWMELTVSATVPTVPSGLPVTHMSAVILHNPNASAVWVVDGGLVEQAEYTGRYFDGDSDYAWWGEESPTVPGTGTGTAHASTSTLSGGKIITIWELADNNWVRLDFTGSTTYNADASDLMSGFLAPARLADNSIPYDKMLTNSVQVADAVAAFDLVNVFQVGTVYQIRPADASSGREAHGFVLEAGNPGDVVPVYHVGINPCGGLLPGTVFLGEDGAVSTVPPQGSGAIVQEVGFGSDGTNLHFNPQSPIWLT